MKLKIDEEKYLTAKHARFFENRALYKAQSSQSFEIKLCELCVCLCVLCG
jgi:hypothetical protein